jgi:hypothetical protein
VKQVSDTEDDGEEADEYADTDPSALTDFREPLAPYGTWVVDATYGTVWVPDENVVGADFAPYQTAGHWALTDSEEWLWVSDYDWGYIPFHYGRWIWVNGTGWAWIPGRAYAPAWVSFRIGDGGYVGWAPMPPTWYWSGGTAVNLWATPYAAYCFVPTTYVFHEHVYTYVVRDAAAVRTIATGTRAYTPARPTVVGSTAAGGAAAGSRSHHFRVASPKLAEARISGSSAPRARVMADPRAVVFAKRSSTAALRRAVAAGHGFEGRAFPRNVSPRASFPARSSEFSGEFGSRTPTAREARTRSPIPRTPRETPAFDPAPHRSAKAVNAAPRSPAPAVDATPRRPLPVFAPAPHRPLPVSRPAFTPAAPLPVSRPAFTPPAPVSRPSFPVPRAQVQVAPAPAHPSTKSSTPSVHSSGGTPSGGHSGVRRR